MALKEHNEKKEEARLVADRVRKKEAQAIAATNAVSKPYQDKAHLVKAEIESALSTDLHDELRVILEKIGLQECLIGGSYVSRALSKVVARVFKGDNRVDVPRMVANDIDVFHGHFETGKLNVFRSCIWYIEDVNGLDLPINAVKCSHLSAESFLSNNDLNATASCIHLKSPGGEDAGEKRVKFSLHVQPQLWQLLLSQKCTQQIEVVNPYSLDNPATTCVRAAYKAMQMKIKLGKV